VFADTIDVYLQNNTDYTYTSIYENYIGVKFIHRKNGLLNVDRTIISLMVGNNTAQSVTTYSNYYTGNNTVVLQIPEYNLTEFTIKVEGVGKYWEVSSNQIKPLNITQNFNLNAVNIGKEIVSSSSKIYNDNLIYLLFL
jgi:hypothetical protein